MVVTFLGAAVSFVSNYIMFMIWGLNFALVASPSDIIVGFIEALNAILPIAMFSGIGVFAASLVFSLVTKAGMTRAINLFRCMFYIPAVASFLLILGLIFGLSEIYFENIDRPVVLIAIWLAVALISFSIKVLYDWSSHLVNAANGLGIKLPDVEGHGRNQLTASLGFIAIFSVLSIIISAMYGCNDAFLEGVSPRCGKAPERIVWVGTSSIVTTCTRPPFDQADSYFISKRDGITISVRSKPIRAEQKHAQTR